MLGLVLGGFAGLLCFYLGWCVGRIWPIAGAYEFTLWRGPDGLGGWKDLATVHTPFHEPETKSFQATSRKKLVCGWTELSMKATIYRDGSAIMTWSRLPEDDLLSRTAGATNG